MNKLIVPVITVIVVISTILSGCAQPAPAPEPAPAPAPAPAPSPTPQIPTEPAGKWPQPNPYWGLGFKPDGTEYQFAVEALGLGFSYWVVVAKSCQGYLQRSGANCELHDPNNTLDTQISQMEDSIAKNVDAIVLFATDSAGMAPVTDRAGEAGIPVFCFDIEVYSDAVVHRTTYDNADKGALGAQALVDAAERMNVDLNLYQVVSLVDIQSCASRQEGFEAAIAGNPLVASVIKSPVSDTPDDAMNAIADTLPAHPELNAIYLNCGDADSAKMGLTNLGRLHDLDHPDHVIVVVQDGFPSALAGLREDWVDGCPINSPWAIGDIVSKAVLTNICQGKTVPALVEIPLELITKANVDTSPYGGPMRWGDMIEANPDPTIWPILDTEQFSGIAIPSYK